MTEFWLPSRAWDARTREEMERRLNRHVLPKLGDKRLDQLARSPTIVSGWLAGLPVGARYADEILHTLSTVLSAARDDGRMASNPCQAGSVRAPKPVRRKLVPWTAAQVATARASMPEQFQAMADCAAGLGLRQGEIIGLPLDCVDFLRRTVHVRVQVRRVRGQRVFAPPKSRRERDVPLPGNVSVALAEHVRRFPPVKVTLPWLEPGGKPHAETLIFTGSRRSALSATYWDKSVWRPAARAAGMAPSRENGLHALRHHYASTLLRNGIDVKRVSAWLGHTSAAFTLATYIHLLGDDDGRDVRDVELALTGSSQAVKAIAIPNES